jgi:ABC-type uncharacterized transport system permease subunit
LVGFGRVVGEIVVVVFGKGKSGVIGKGMEKAEVMVVVEGEWVGELVVELVRVLPHMS